ncbi:MAG: PAS domain S-box protein [Nitrospirae bacterium]|nr:PAS domain S-box protein [Candidatus Manganitrophaceae bacterium]
MIFLLFFAGVVLLLSGSLWAALRQGKAPPQTSHPPFHPIDQTLNRIDEAVVVSDAAWTLLDCNPAFTALFGYTNAELKGKTLFSLFAAEADLPEGRPDRNVPLTILRYRKRNGAVFPGETSFSYQQHADPRFNRIIALVRDGTERVEAEEKIKHLNESLERRIADRTAQLQAMNTDLQAEINDRKRIERHLAAEHAVTQILAKSRALTEVAPRILQILCENLEWDLGLFWITNDQVRVLTCIESWSRASINAIDAAPFESTNRESLFWPDEGLPGQVWTDGEPIWLPDIAEADNFTRKASAQRAGLRAALAFPIRGRTGVSGVIEFFSREVKRPNTERLQLLSNIGSQIGQFIDRKESERALWESETRKRAILAAAPDSMITIDHEGTVLEFNPAAERMFGYSKGSILGLNIADRIIPPHLRERHREAIARYLAAEEGSILNRRIETTAMRADGTEFPVELTIIRIPLDGPPLFQGFLRDLTERKEIEAKLHQRERRFRALIEQSSDAIALVTASGTTLYASPSTSRLLGYSIDEFITKKVFDLIHPEDQERTRLLFGRLIHEPGRRVTAEYRIRHKDGAWRWMEGIATNLIEDPGVGAVVVNYRDITDRKRTEEALAAEKEWLAVTLGSIGDGVMATDVAGSILFINKAAQALSGWGAEEAIGRPLQTVFRIVDERSRAKVENPVQEVLETGEVVALANHTLLIARDGKEHAIADSAAPIRDREGRIIGVVLVFRDVTEKERMEGEFLKTSTLEPLGILAGGVAHDFNNILTSILGNLSLSMLSIDSDTDLHRHLTQAEKASNRARDLAQQLLTFAKGGTPVKKTASVVDLLKESSNFAVRGSNVRCSFILDEAPWPVEIDEGQISQVIHNLILNAQQAMPEGGTIEIKAENRWVEEEESRTVPLKEGPYLRISIRDFGVGMPREHLMKIFDPYFTTKEKGTGLGLSTSYSIIKKHDGHIEVESELGSGSTFSIYLPARPGAAIQEMEKPTELSALKGEGRILVVDDEEGIRHVVGEMLRHLGYEVTATGEGADAIERYRHASEAGRPFDLMMIDLTIPGGMGGKEAAKRLREIDPQARIVAVSGYSSDPIQSELKDSGFSGFIPKPFSLNELGQMVKEVLAKQPE